MEPVGRTSTTWKLTQQTVKSSGSVRPRWEAALVIGAAILGMKRFTLEVAQAPDGECFVTSHRIALEASVHSTSR